MKYFNSVDELVGNTPLVRLNNIEKIFNAKAKIFAKLEYLNPAGSVKDRVAREMIDAAEKNGVLKSDTVIIEPTSGNTGIGLASVAASRGYRVVIVMPDTMSVERIKIMKAYGAEVVLSDGSLGMSGAIKKAEELSAQYPDSFIAGQFENPANPEAHFKTTGPEIYADTDGEVDIFVSAVGTGGTITGTAKYLKSQKTGVCVVGVEPEESPVLSGGKSGPHKIQGIGAGFVPDVLDIDIIDEIITVSSDNAYAMARDLCAKEGILAGISSGAALYAAAKLSERDENAGKNIVVILPDTGDRYLSTDLF